MASWFTNMGVLTITSGWSECRKANQFCVAYPSLSPEMNISDALDAKTWFEQALWWQPDSAVTRLHLAGVYFSLGWRFKAVQTAYPLKTYPPARNPLVSAGRAPGRYEHYLFLAEQLLLAEKWSDAVQNFRLGLAFGHDQSLPIDLQLFYQALSQDYLQQFKASPNNPRLAFLVGKYKYFGNMPDARQWFERALEIGQGDASYAPEMGQALLYLGQLEESASSTAQAQAFYQDAIAIAPGLREAHVRLLINLREQNKNQAAAQVENHLLELGPTYLLGRQSADASYQLPAPGVFSGDWTLVGYDLDQEQLENGGLLDIWLWWLPPAKPFKSSTGRQWVRIGEYWVEQRQVHNLYPNAGFEWGTDPTGIPLAQDRSLYQSSPENLRVITTKRDGLETQVLAAFNDEQNPSVALASHPTLANPAQYYLMAGWLWDTSRAANIGRNCWWQDGGGPYYIAYEKQEPFRPLETWVHVADLNILFPDQHPDGCETLLIHYMNQEQAMWDDILWVEIEKP